MAVRESEFASQVVDSLTSGVVGIDTSGCVVLFNEGARRLLAPPLETCEAALGRPIAEVLTAQPRLAPLLLAALDGRAPMSRAEISLAGGGTAGLTLGAVRDTGGALTGAVLLLRDLTAFERSDERQRLQERLAALGEMAAGMAHEIRNPLAGMEVIAGLLRRRVVGEERELAVELSEQIRNVADTVTASLDFVRPLEPRGRTLDIRSLLDEALRQGTARRSLALTVERDIASPLPEVRGDASLLTTALASLIANACEAMAACDGASGAHLLLRVRSNRVLSSGPQEPVLHPPAAPVVREVAAAPEIVISVEDSGPGIAPSEHERIFYPFYTTKQQGSGIGLAQAQKIAMAHGGGVRVESGSGRGATFHMHLPAIGVER
jgi:two-component system nitrogen regulation sensor histidine kinase GlnL